VVVKDEVGSLLGFGLLRAYSAVTSFSHAAEITYFLRPEHTHKGIGTQILEHLTEGANKQGITCLLASISSLNEASLRFHRRHGFVECGRFRRVGKKQGTFFDVVWMQKMLLPPGNKEKGGSVNP